ncbi:hypothetical protein GIX45_16380 [Erwinia sp. CPCC 100877]|nr:hypothetical protein [Erwinia sp. CPCC 100877]
MGFINTVDLTDAFFGCAGVAVSFIFLMIMVKYGLDDLEVSEVQEEQAHERS